MKFHPAQSQVAKDNHDYRVVVCGRQWGKTTLAVWEMLGCAYAKKDKKVAYFATTFDQARNIAWTWLKQATQAVWAKPPNESRLELFINTVDKGVSEISLRGFENIETARGQQFDLLVIDEVAYMHNWQYAWEAILEPTLTYRRGKALFISSPRGYDHLHAMYMRGQQYDQHWKSWRFTSYDNPFLPVDRIEIAKKNNTTDYFSQEYLAEFVRFTGLIYKDFDFIQHVHPFDFERNQHGDYYFGLDFAVRGYTASVAAFIDTKGEVYILDEYKKDADTAKNHAQAIKTMLMQYADFSRYTGYADPAGWMKNQQKGDMLWSLADEYLEDSFPMVQANNEVTAGINYVQQLIRNNKLHIHPRCQQLVGELLSYQWKEQPIKQIGLKTEPEEPRKINDHLVDALRYLLYSKPVAPEQEEPKRTTVFPLRFPEPKIDKPDENEDQYTPIDIPSLYD